MLRWELTAKRPLLQAGQTIRYDNELWRVDYVNDCRAQIRPLVFRKRGKPLEDGEMKDYGGLSIAPDSFVEIITDLDRALTEKELREAERELREAEQELVDARSAAKDRVKLAAELAAAEAELKAMQAEAGATTAVTPTRTNENVSRKTGARKGSGAQWAIQGTAPFAPSGSLKAAVLAYLKAHPGATTKDVAGACKGSTPGAVAACLDRFWDAGVLTKS